MTLRNFLHRRTIRLYLATARELRARLRRQLLATARYEFIVPGHATLLICEDDCGAFAVWSLSVRCQHPKFLASRDTLRSAITTASLAMSRRLREQSVVETRT